MPVYEYRCTSCGDQIAISTRIEDVWTGGPKDFSHTPEGLITGFENSNACSPTLGLKRVWSVGFQIKSTDWGH